MTPYKIPEIGIVDFRSVIFCTSFNSIEDRTKQVKSRNCI